MSALIVPAPRLISLAPHIVFSVDTTPDYSISDQIGQAMEIPNAARFAGGGGVLNQLTVRDNANQAASLIFSFFRDNPSTSANDNNSALALSDADMDLLLFSVLVPTGRILNVATGRQAATIPLGYNYTCVGTSLWVVASAATTINYAAITNLAIIPGMTVF